MQGTNAGLNSQVRVIGSNRRRGAARWCKRANTDNNLEAHIGALVFGNNNHLFQNMDT